MIHKLGCCITLYTGYEAYLYSIRKLCGIKKVISVSSILSSGSSF